jgi:hypothetical protein
MVCREKAMKTLSYNVEVHRTQNRDKRTNEYLNRMDRRDRIEFP